MEYLAWGAALFFAGSWTYGLMIRPDFRVKSTIVTILYWWIAIGLALGSSYSLFHLLWLMPMALFIPMVLMQAEMASRLTTSVESIFVKSLFVMGPAFAALLYWS